eukprot:TRINITY_DN7013_c0_g1_i1.p1 TRINITY_DN7013_c0_g1~~TRINITY_DN7013_c0_g1_i1.p1  ORF type:complete len:237 (-),score=39.44 TRINITY_DN7013_c0_g1_i1:307-1017(-)
MAEPDAFGLIAQLHGQLLRMLSLNLNTHCSGLQQAARLGRHRGLLDNRTSRKLAHIDICFNLCRHITSVYADELYHNILKKVSTACERDQDDGPDPVSRPAEVREAVRADLRGVWAPVCPLAMPKVLPPDMLDNLYFKFKKADDVRNITDVVDKIASHHADFIVKELSETPVAEAMSFDAAQLLLGGVLRKQVFALVPAFAVGLPDALQVHVDAALDRHVLDMTIRVLICKGWPCD